jgi:hypothetical protein
VSDLRARVLATVAAEPSPTRAAVRRHNQRLGVLAAASAIGTFVIFAALMSDSHLLRLGGEVGPRQHVERSLWLVVTTASGAVSVAAAAVWLALGSSRSMLGRSRRALLYGGLLIPLGLLAWKLGASLAFGDAMVPWPERPGERCLSLSLLVAAGPLLSFLAIRRHAPGWPALNGAVIGCAAGACAWVAVELWCPVSYAPHLLLGHVLPIFVLAGVGGLLGRARLALRSG